MTCKSTVVFFGLGVFLGLPFAVRLSGIMLNSTDSVPVGLYCQVRTGPYAGICLEKKAFEGTGLQLDRGDCPAGVEPILKPLYIASAKHPIRFTEAGFSVDGTLLRNTAPKSYSRTGVMLHHFNFGEYTSGIFAISDFNRDSFDSRYFGPVEPDSIRFYAKPVWMF